MYYIICLYGSKLWAQHISDTDKMDGEVLPC